MIQSSGRVGPAVDKYISIERTQPGYLQEGARAFWMSPERVAISPPKGQRPIAIGRACDHMPTEYQGLCSKTRDRGGLEVYQEGGCEAVVRKPGKRCSSRTSVWICVTPEAT